MMPELAIVPPGRTMSRISHTQNSEFPVSSHPDVAVRAASRLGKPPN